MEDAPDTANIDDAPDIVNIDVIDSRFCSQHTVRLTFGTRSDHLAVTDAGGNTLFKVKEADNHSLGGKLVIVVEGSADNPALIRMKAKVCTLHHRWQVFGGDGLEQEQLLFTVKKSSTIQRRTELDVFLAANTSEEEADFKIKGSYESKNCTVHKGESSIVLAQMTRKCEDPINLVLSKEDFGVTVNPTMDRALVTVLFTILGEIKKREKIMKKVATVAGHAVLIGINIGLGVAQIVTNKK